MIAKMHHVRFDSATLQAREAHLQGQQQTIDQMRAEATGRSDQAMQAATASLMLGVFAGLVR